MMQHMATYAGSNITTELIQKRASDRNYGSVDADLRLYLDENKQLILAILDNQNLGKLNECATYQAKLQQNLMYLAAIADAQPQGGQSSQMQAPAPTMQPAQQYMQQQQQQLNMLNQRNAMMPSYLQQNSYYNQQQHSLLIGGSSGSMLMMSHDRGMGGNGPQASPGYADGTGRDHGNNQLSMAMQADMQHHGGNGSDMGHCGSPHGGNGQGNDDSEASYLKGSDGSSL